MPTVVAISDLHGLLPDDLPRGDLLVIAGDVCPVHDHAVGFQHRWLEESFYPWLDVLPHAEVAWIAGNHDFVCQIPQWKPGGRGHYLRDEEVELCGLSVHGTPWVPNLPRWAFYATEAELARRSEAIGAVDVLVSHGPPYGIGDLVTRGEHVGSDPLRKRLKKEPWPLCVFGHIHEAYGSWRLGEALYANVAAVDELYEPRANAAMRFEVSGGRAEVI
ncbi:MAG: metallophosphoesterase family protein [Solirubrobacterales bacterium]